jgi:polyvinyl alcohol dehydrogenase (cytochrome)
MHGQLLVAGPGGGSGSTTTTSSTTSTTSTTLALPPPPPGGTDWPLYGADTANSRTAPGGPGTSAAATLKQAWRFDASDGDFTGTPVVSGGVVFVGSNGSKGTKSNDGKVRALNALNGTLLWTQTVDGPVNASLAVSNGVVYVPVAKVGGPALAAFKTDGTPLWETTLDTQTDADVYGSPTVAGGLVVQGTSALFGELNDPKVAVRGSVVALDAATGVQKWKTYTVDTQYNGGAVWSTPAVDAGVVYAGTGNAYQAPAAPTTDSIIKLDLATGAILGHFQATSGDVWNGTSNAAGVDYDFGASPNLATLPDGTAVVGEGQKSGTYWAVKRADLSPVWHTTVGPGSAVGGILGSTAYDGARVYGPITAPGYIWSLNAKDGAPAWVTPGAADPIHWSAVAESNGVVWSANSGGFLDGWDAATGVPVAHLPLNSLDPSPSGASYGAAFGGVSVADGMVFADTGSQGTKGSVVAFKP